MFKMNRRLFTYLACFALVSAAATTVFAQEAASATADTTKLTAVFTSTGGWIAIAAALSIAIAAFGGALGQAKVAASALEGVARNPAASGKLLIPLVMSLALIESLVIYALLISLDLNKPVVNTYKALTPVVEEAKTAGH